MALLDRLHSRARALDRLFAQLGRMRITRRFTGDRAQAETLCGVECRHLEATIVKGQSFRLAIFKE